MIILDTHIWVWWSMSDARLTAAQRRLTEQSDVPLGLCSISLREIAAACTRGRLVIEADLMEWLNDLVTTRRSRLLTITAQIAAESVQLPGEFHRDPFDQIIVATARVLDCPLMTSDGKILRYPHVLHASLNESNNT